jgi:hypothetical protein
MAQRTTMMGSRRRLARLLSQARITGTDEEIAVTHEINRQTAVKEIFLHVFFMAKFRFIPGILTVEKAESQYLGAHGDDEAAHCAPGQIMSGGRAIQQLLTASDDLQLEVETLFGKTDELHGRFNKADSRAEENGLRAAFGAACNFIAQKGRTVRFNRAYDFYPYMSAAFNQYKMAGIAAFDLAIGVQRAMTDPLVGVTRAELVYILETYRATLAAADSTLETVQGLFPEELWRDYRSLRP